MKRASLTKTQEKIREESSDIEVKKIETIDSTVAKTYIDLIQNLQKEIDHLKPYKQQVEKQHLKIQHLEKKIRTMSKEKNNLKHHLSATRTGVIGGCFDSSNSSTNLRNSSLMKGKKPANRKFEKPYQELVIHLKSKHNQKIIVEDQQNERLNKLPSPKNSSKAIIDEIDIKRMAE